MTAVPNNELTLSAESEMSEDVLPLPAVRAGPKDVDSGLSHCKAPSDPS